MVGKLLKYGFRFHLTDVVIVNVPWRSESPITRETDGVLKVAPGTMVTNQRPALCDVTCLNGDAEASDIRR